MKSLPNIVMQIFKKIPSLKILQTSVFVYPTETCYGLGCDALRPDLVKRIYQIKDRDFNKPVSWIVADIGMAANYVVFSKKAIQLAQKFWPGPLTLVLPLLQAQKSVNHLTHMRKMIDINFGKDFGDIGRDSGIRSGMIGLRVPSHKMARDISKTLGKPVVSTSANLSGAGECYSVKEVISQFKDSQFQPDFIIDGGVLLKKPPSTVAKVVGNNIEILRQGECAIY